ncbi:hypothetical protein GCM10007390_41700 [Persicitalea jodogahamensis]|uniref:Gliding motility-associated C-terminal domain-containing protein n=2 Tax=Persicitalea jodogahamensis TaxID=402147 RepID=A0A8J3DCD3_9BACT|nr:hypothetical protein GCM10007390_41700 [Persicitalea jodogahamensis]
MTENGCVALDSIQVIVIDCSLPPVPLIESNNSVETSIEICPERPVLLQIREPGDWTYQWKLDGSDIPGGDGDTHYASKVGKYSVTRRFKNSELCRLFSISKSVNLIPGNPPIIDINGNNIALCPGGSIDIETTANESYTYRWLYEQNPNIIGSEASVSVNEIGMYQLVVTNEENGCTSQEKFDVKSDTSTIPTPTIYYNGQTTEAIAFCAGETKMLEIQNPGDWVYQWYLDGILIKNANSAALPLSKEGFYTVEKNYDAGKHCAGPATSKPVEVVVFDSPEAEILRASEVLCSGNKLDLEAQANDSYNYTWQFNSKILAETGSRLTVSEGGFYQLTIIDKQNNCSNRDSVFIAEEMIAVELPDKIIIRRGGSTILDPTSSSSAQDANYLWTPSYGLDDPDALKTKAFPDQTTSYVLVGKTPGGCTAADTTEIIVVDRIYIPDAFTPNGDGINDLLMVANGKELVESINIYNRWGSLVFHSENYENPWDGTFHNTKVPSGNYTYIIRTSIETYKGSIMVLY